MRLCIAAAAARLLPSAGGLAFAALLALVVMAPVGAQAGQPVEQTYTCLSGSFLTGLQGRAGDWLDQFQPVCRTWSPSAGSGGETYGDTFGNVNGGNRAVRSPCAVGSAIYGITYDIASPNGPPGHVYNVNVGCVALPYFNANVRIRLDGQASTGSSVFNFCPNGTIAKGVTIGLDGINITSLVPVCDTVNDIVAAAAPSRQPTSPKAGPVCPTGWMKVVDPGLLPAGWETKTISAGGITIICAKRRIRLTPSQILKLVPLQPPPAATKLHRHCGPGTVWWEGHCVPACPDGSVMPANGYCGGSTSQSDHPCGPGTVRVGHHCAPACPDGTPIPQNGACPGTTQPSSPPCDNNQLRLPDGSCPRPPPRLLPRATTPTINLHNAPKFLACPDGQPRQKDGECPAPKFHLKGIYRPPAEQPR